MTPQEGANAAESAVRTLATIISRRAEFTELDLYTSLAESSIPSPLADRAYKFTMIAWGRILLDGLGIHFSPDYYCLDGSGSIVESGQLVDDPCYAMAIRLAPEFRHCPGFARFALMSADVNTVNSMLNAGSKPQHLVLAPAVMFTESPTPSGMERARALISKLLQKQSATVKKSAVDVPKRPSKPWWRFW